VGDAWMPGVRYVRATSDGGPLKGGAPRAVWQALGADPQTVSARSAAQRLDQHDQASHLVWNPLNGEIVQLIPIVRAARSLALLDCEGAASAADRAAGAAVTAEGRVCVQICVVAFGREPFTAGPMAGLHEILTWLDSWGIPRCWPGGAPAPFPDCVAVLRSRRLWARGGHFGASQVPGLSATGPGAIDIERLTGWSAGHAAPAAAGAAAALSGTALGDTALSGAGLSGTGLSGAALSGAALSGANGSDPSLSEFLGNHVAVAASLTRVR
jgi:hypothetical protein